MLRNRTAFKPGNARRRGALVVALWALQGGETSYAHTRAPILESVDLSVPMAPVTVKIAGTNHVVHELHITNFQRVDVAIVRVQVRTAGGTPAAIADHHGAELWRRIGRPGRRRDVPDAHVVGPGMRAVVYFWIALPGESATPQALDHSVELEILRETAPVRATVDGAFARVSKEPVPALDPPLRGGPWVAIYSPLLSGGHRTAIYTLEGRARIPGRLAIDWIRLPADGVMHNSRSSPPSDWNGYGTEVLAVGDGVVAAAMDDIAENETTPGAPAAPIPPENASGNYVALELERGRFAFYEHLKRGSLAVKAGDRVKSGQVIGRLGNSGSSSIGPHLHFHVGDTRSPLAAEGLPFVFERFDHLGAFSSIESLLGGERWIANPEGNVNARTRERPAANAVVHFR
jgi:murein DD-endopeptidase